MVASTIKTFANKVLWDNVDFLIIDMPPGTGDALLTFSQEIDIDGAVIVTTPQDIAIIDVKRGIEMFKRTNVKILGIIENMTSFTSDDGIEHFILRGGVEVLRNVESVLVEINESFEEQSNESKNILKGAGLSLHKKCAVDSNNQFNQWWVRSEVQVNK